MIGCRRAGRGRDSADGVRVNVGGDAEPLRVVYIAGAQHCGSTMLDAVLGAAPGARSLGEVGGFHRHSEGAVCDCGRPAASCSPCRDVVTKLADTSGLERFGAVSRLPLKERRAHWTVVGGARRREYARLADAVFDAAAAATGASILIDSSKNAGRAGALVHESRHDIRVVHLVRDGRSYLASKRRRAAAEGRRVVPPLALGTWLVKNLLLWSLLRRRVGRDRYLLCRYEDLIADPERELDRIGRFAGLDTAGLGRRAIELGVDRDHLFEPQRRLDYHRVVLDPARASASRATSAVRHPLLYWVAGGFVSRRWGYTRAGLKGTPAGAVR